MEATLGGGGECDEEEAEEEEDGGGAVLCAVLKCKKIVWMDGWMDGWVIGWLDSVAANGKIFALT